MDKKETIEVGNLHKLIGKDAYLVYGKSILRQTIGYVGFVSFIILAFSDDLKHDFLEWKYVDFGKKWTLDLEEAKDLLADKFPGKEIVEVDDGYWEAE